MKAIVSAPFIAGAAGAFIAEKPSEALP